MTESITPMCPYCEESGQMLDCEIKEDWGHIKCPACNMVYKYYVKKTYVTKMVEHLSEIDLKKIIK